MNYQNEAHKLYSNEGISCLLRIKKNVDKGLACAGAIKASFAMAGCTGDTFMFMNCLDKLEQEGEIHQVTPPGVAGQDRVYIKGRLK